MQESDGRVAMSMLSKLLVDKNFSLAKWEATRAMGRTNYIIRYGVWGWGLSMFFAMTLLFRFQAANYDLACMTFSWSTVCINAVIFSVAGYFMGSGMWVANEGSRRGSP
jgi:hypothetical protein